MPYQKTQWKNGEAPAINETNLNKIEDAIESATNTAESAASDLATLSGEVAQNTSDIADLQSKATAVSVNPILTSGTKIAEITVDGDKKNLYAPSGGGGGGGASDWSELTGKPFEDISADDFSVDDDGVLHVIGGGGEGGSGKISVETELLATESTTDVVTKTVKSLSDFDFVMLCAVNGSGHINQNQIVPIDLFRTLNTEANSMGLDIYITKRYTSIAYYRSDTSIGLRGMNPSDSGLTTRFYGIKLSGGSGSGQHLTVLPYTLQAGDSTCTITSSKIKSDSILQPMIWAEDGEEPKEFSVTKMVVRNGSCTLTFNAVSVVTQIGLAILGEAVESGGDSIKKGYAVVTLPANGDVSASITFDKPFATPPTVVACLSNYKNNNFAWTYATVAVTNITENGFKLSAHHLYNGSLEVKINWIAIG